MGFLSSLSREQKRSVFLLQSGTFLEYFDLMLYVHMAAFLNELFFPKASGFSASLLSAFAFCSTFVFRPLGALLFGYIGDHFGRKQTVMITCALMSCSCITMGAIPTYETLGITAAVVLTLCRALQGMSSMGELVGAGVYLVETIRRPACYSAVAWLVVSANVGGMVALGIATLLTSLGCNWRVVFFFGAAIAVIGTLSRSMLRETPEFIQSKQNAQPIQPQPTPHRTLLALFFTFCVGPVAFYFVFVYCGDVLKNIFGYTSQEIVRNNLMVAVSFVISNAIIARLTYHIYPLKLMRFFLIFVTLVVLVCPYVLNYASYSWHITLLQILVGNSLLGTFPGTAILYKHIPILKRMTFICIGYAFAKAFMYVLVSFGLIYLKLWLGHWGLWVLMVPTLIAFAWALKHFEKLDKPYKDTTDDFNQEDQEMTDSLLRAA